MNTNLRTEVERSLQKILNQRQQVKEISEKLDKLNSQLNSLQSGIEKEEDRLNLLGLKQSRRDGKPESPEEAQRKISFNDRLKLEKLELIKNLLKEKGVYDSIENFLPNVYRDSNLN